MRWAALAHSYCVIPPSRTRCRSLRSVSSGVRGSAPAPPLCGAERTTYPEPSLHGDVMDFLGELRRRTPLVRIGSMGKSAEGRDMPVVVCSKLNAFTPARARRIGRPIVLINANIHAG